MCCRRKGCRKNSASFGLRNRTERRIPALVLRFPARRDGAVRRVRHPKAQPWKVMAQDWKEEPRENQLRRTSWEVPRNALPYRARCAEALTETNSREQWRRRVAEFLPEIQSG